MQQVKEMGFVSHTLVDAVVQQVYLRIAEVTRRAVAEDAKAVKRVHRHPLEIDARHVTLPLVRDHGRRSHVW